VSAFELLPSITVTATLDGVSSKSATVTVNRSAGTAETPSAPPSAPPATPPVTTPPATPPAGGDTDATPADPVVVPVVIVEVEVESVGADVEDGVATVELDDDAVEEILEAIEDAIADLDDDEALVIGFSVDFGEEDIDDIDEVIFGIPAAIAEALAEALDDGADVSIVVDLGLAAIEFDAETLAAIIGDGDEDIIISVAKPDIDDEDIAELIGDRPVFSFSVSVGGEKVTEFANPVSVSIPYTLSADEDPLAIVIWYVDADGEYKVVRGVYADGKVNFVINHFSMFVIAYLDVDFADTAGKWFADAATFVGARELIIGVGFDGDFDGDKALTREEFLSTLMRAYNIPLDDSAELIFTDVDEDSPYAPYLATAFKLGITTGRTATTFGFGGTVERQEMFVFLYRILDAIDELPAAIAGRATLADFPDADKVGAYAVNAISVLLEGGLISGMGAGIYSGTFSPLNTADRAAMATLVYRLLTGSLAPDVVPAPAAPAAAAAADVVDDCDDDDEDCCDDCE
jgi:hypothetical protein